MREKQFIYEMKNLSMKNEDLVLNETLFHNANGYIGIRSNFEEGYPEGYDTIRGSYINGFYDIASMKQAEKLYGLVDEKQTMLNVVDTQTIKIWIDQEEFSMFQGTILDSKQWLDMKLGYSARKVVWRSPSGKEVEIVSKRMTSFHQLSLFTIEYSVKALNFQGNIEIHSAHIGEVENYSNVHDPRVSGERGKYLIPASVKVIDGVSYITTNTSKSGLSVCTAVKNVLSKDSHMDIKIDGHSSIATMKTRIEQDEIITLTKYTVFTDSIRNKEVENHAIKEMEEALSVPLAKWYEYQATYLEDYWTNCLLDIYGDDDLDLAIKYNMYQLVQSVGKDKYSNIAAKGLSGEGYEGHYFWDTEMYIQPFFNLTKPSVTRNLIEYRYEILDQARDHAKVLGHQRGALYPWRTIMGKECSGYFLSGSAQYHINGDIAYAIIAYYLATKDVDLILHKGAEILFETARLWMDVGHYHKGKFMICEVTGPDEYTCLVDNNYYTNVSAQFNLRWAAKLYNQLKGNNQFEQLIQKINLTEDEIESFEQAANYMYLPYDEELDINPQDDSFLKKPIWDIENTPKDKFPLLLHYHPLHLYRYQVCKQADTVLAHFIFEEAQSMETIKNSFEYYEEVTTHDSSLSTCIFSIVASKLGLKDKAYDYFGDSAKLDLFNTHKNTKDGIHTANMGGSYMAIVYGFAGLRIKENGISFAPTLPTQWDGYRFKIQYEDSQIQVDVVRETTKFTLVEGNPVKIELYGKEHVLENSLVVLTK